MKMSIPGKIALMSLIFLTGSVVIISSLFAISRRVAATEAMVEHTEDVVSATASIISLSKTIETNSLAYIINCDTEYLAPMHIAAEGVNAAIAALHVQTLDNSSQGSRISALGYYAERHLEAAEEMISARNIGGRIPSYAGMSEPKAYSERVHRIAVAIAAEEERLLTTRREDAARASALFFWFEILLSLFIIVFTILILISVSRYWQQQQRQRIMEIKNENLTARVIDRTAKMDQYKYFFYHTLDLACLANADGYFEEVNENFVKTLGYTADDLAGKKLTDFIHPDDVDAMLNVIELLEGGEHAINFINRYLAQDGEYKYFEWTSVFNTDTHKIHALARNVTERVEAMIELTYQNAEKGKRAEELAIANEELLFQNTEKENRAAELIIANHELAYQNSEKGKRADELAAANEHLLTARDAIHKLNESLEQKVSDRTAELTAANKDLESFSYSVSHDLRAPMTSITAFTRIINEEYAPAFDEELRGLFHFIESSSVRMTAIIDDLLTLAKNDKEKMVTEEVGLTVLFHEVWDNMMFSAPHHAQVEIAEIPIVMGDSSMLRQVVVNLLSNAIKYSSKHQAPLISVKCEVHDYRLIVSIRDNGVGFDMKFYDRLFGAFQRLHGMSEFQGTGVGLTLVKRIIDRHGGEVWAVSKVGKGATFYFSLPLPEKTLLSMHRDGSRDAEKVDGVSSFKPFHPDREVIEAA